MFYFNSYVNSRVWWSHIWTRKNIEKRLTHATRSSWVCTQPSTPHTSRPQVRKYAESISDQPRPRRSSAAGTVHRGSHLWSPGNDLWTGLWEHACGRCGFHREAHIWGRVSQVASSYGFEQIFIQRRPFEGSVCKYLRQQNNNAWKTGYFVHKLGSKEEYEQYSNFIHRYILN